MIAALLLWLIRIYQWAFSPLLGNVCRFEPSCSRYAAACIASRGALRGSLLSIIRVCKCHPFHPGGFDPPPALDQTASRSTLAAVTAPSLKAPPHGP